jgi:hypothetical protein
MKIMKKVILFILAGVLLLACSNTEEVKSTIDTSKYFTTTDMVQLDKVYVPALFLTNKNEREKSKKALEKLQSKWEIFSSINYEILNSSQKEKFDEISSAIVKAKNITNNSNIKLVDAHEELEIIREILFEIRKDFGINYYMDEITAFHTSMEETIESKNDINKLKHHLISLNEALDKLESYDFDTTLYQFNEQKNTKRLEIIKTEREAIKNLEKAIKNEELNDKVILGIKPNFIKLFLLFGN